jgi:hypothetical protein
MHYTVIVVRNKHDMDVFRECVCARAFSSIRLVVRECVVVNVCVCCAMAVSRAFVRACVLAVARSRPGAAA